MAKTPEELEALKEQIRNVKNELRNLSEEELKQVAGGDGEVDCKKLTCPKCGSTNISTTVIAHVEYHTCKDCGYKWNI